MRLVVATLVIALASPGALAQNFPQRAQSAERLADELFPLQELDLNYEELYENLLQLLAHPIDLNRASAEDLAALFVLKDQQIRNIIAHRQAFGPFLSVYELQAVPDLDVETIYRLMPFVRVGDRETQLGKQFLSHVWHDARPHLIVRAERTLEQRKGFKPETDSTQRYAGSSTKYYARFRHSRPGDFSFGFTIEKDAGEAWAWHKRQPGFDYHSMHAQVLNKGRLKNWIVGDYQAQFGQGLILGGGFGMGKNAETVQTVRRSNLGFLPYTSVVESGFFRGSALSYELHRVLTLHAFASQVHRDGTLGQDSTEQAGFTSSLLLSGLHRTPSERQSRKAIRETNTGGVLQLKVNNTDAGLIVHQTNLAVPLIRRETPYNQFAFRGSTNTNVGMYINQRIAHISLFAEAAHSIGQGSGAVAGLLASLTPRLDIALHYRHYQRNYFSFYSNALAESTAPQNESGVYWGWKYTVSKKTMWTGYADLFQFPWLRFRVYTPSQGHEWLLKFSHRPNKQVNFFVQVREEVKARNITTDNNLYQVGQGRKRNAWLNIDYDVGPFEFKSRVQASTYALANITTGFALIQDLTWQKGKFSATGRYALFDTDDFDNRQYVYERDVWLAFSFPAYQGVGIRSYVLLSYQLSSRVQVWFRWARTTYTDRESIGSGSETIEGNLRNDLKFQARISM